jgi:hypothetical protein
MSGKPLPKRLLQSYLLIHCFDVSTYHKEAIE